MSSLPRQKGVTEFQPNELCLPLTLMDKDEPTTLM